MLKSSSEVSCSGIWRCYVIIEVLRAATCSQNRKYSAAYIYVHIYIYICIYIYILIKQQANHKSSKSLVYISDDHSVYLM